LGLMFFPAYDGLEGFIDRFGMSVIGTPTDRQMKLRAEAEFAGLRMGAKQWQQEERDACNISRLAIIKKPIAP